MKLVPVTSSQIKAIGYDPNACTLYIQFHDRTKKNGEISPAGTYIYDDVPAEVHAALMEADATDGVSLGTHFGKHVRNGGYAFRRMREE